MWKCIIGEKTQNSAIIWRKLLKISIVCFKRMYFSKSGRLLLSFSNQVIFGEKDSVERHPLKARNIYRCNVIPGNEACGPSLALYDNRRIFWQKSWLLLRSACCPSKPIFDWHLCPIETGITPSEWALCQASRWVWAKACQKPSMCIKFKYQGPKLPSRDIKIAVCWELFVL